MIHIVTDTTAGLPADLVGQYDITVIAQYVHFGEEELKDEVEITPAEFYRRQAEAEEMPKTSAPGPGDFMPVFDRILEADDNPTILCIHPSPHLSGTLRGVKTAAADYPDADIRIFDTRSVSIGLGLMVWEAARMAADGAGADAIIEVLEGMRDSMQVYFVVETLEYLAKGGRIGKASQLLGTLLDIKPILTLEDGEVAPHSKARTRKRSLATLRELIVEAADQQGEGPLWLGVAHALCEDEARPLAERLETALAPEVCMVAELGPAIGTHAGPGTIAVGVVRLGADSYS